MPYLSREVDTFRCNASIDTQVTYFLIVLCKNESLPPA